ncbi:Cob(III)alamin reductase [Klebsiella michiganensis]|uniref:Cob(III)alamin reductase n=1 Tax=Klebsiella michiganensis TaxID=1134687 RepID=A0A7H4M6Y8_9ENTR|nr:Cob(III)alamin reductase [Klebsiella michiganensis]
MSTAVNAAEMAWSAEENPRARARGGRGRRGGRGVSRPREAAGAGRDFSGERRECEPMLKVDQQLMWQQAARLVRGVQYAMTATGAREGVIALKEKYRRAIDALTPLLPAGIRLHILPDVYPAGDEVLTIWLATGRRVAPAALPASVGVVVNNVQTVLNIARAVEQQFAVTRRTLTVNGAVARPLTVTVPIGMSLREVLALAGGATVDDPGFINGGPMMGGLITSLDSPVTKTTGGLLVLPKSHPLIQRRMQDERTVLSVARTVCEQCRLCTDLCPRHLIGHELSSAPAGAGDELSSGRYAAAAAERPHLLGVQRLRKRGLPGGDLADAHQPHAQTRAAGAKPAL